MLKLLMEDMTLEHDYDEVIPIVQDIPDIKNSLKEKVL